MTYSYWKHPRVGQLRSLYTLGLSVRILAEVLNHPDHPDVIPVTLDLLRRSTDSEALPGNPASQKLKT